MERGNRNAIVKKYVKINMEISVELFKWAPKRFSRWLQFPISMKTFMTAADAVVSLMVILIVVFVVRLAKSFVVSLASSKVFVCCHKNKLCATLVPGQGQ